MVVLALDCGSSSLKFQPFASDDPGGARARRVARGLVARYAARVGTPIDRATLVGLHLGNGCSAAAIKGGRSVDTSMGLTPLESLVMGTRSGDVDPALVGHLTRTARSPTAGMTLTLSRSGSAAQRRAGPDQEDG